MTAVAESAVGIAERSEIVLPVFHDDLVIPSGAANQGAPSYGIMKFAEPSRDGPLPTEIERTGIDVESLVAVVVDRQPTPEEATRCSRESRSVYQGGGLAGGGAKVGNRIGVDKVAAVHRVVGEGIQSQNRAAVVRRIGDATACQ